MSVIHICTVSLKRVKRRESDSLGIATLTGGNRHRQKKVEKSSEERTFRRVWKLKENNNKTKFQERVRELVDVDAPNLWNTFKYSMLQACDEVHRKKKGRKNHGDTWWWNEEVKEAIQHKKVAYKMCKNRSEENKAKYNIKNQTKKAVANSMRKEAEKVNKIEQKTK